jgi:predicted ATPase
LKTKRIVISGGPCSGKTALIHYLDKEGYPVKHEISRDVILEARKQGIEQLFLENPILFSQKLLEGRLKQFQEAESCKKPMLFYDRGMPDVTAYMDFVDSHYPEKFSKTCFENRYDVIFILPPWKEIYHTDDERYESWEQAEKIYHYLKDSYKNYGYDIHEVPVGTLKDRVQHILNTLKDIA